MQPYATYSSPLGGANGKYGHERTFRDIAANPAYSIIHEAMGMGEFVDRGPSDGNPAARLCHFGTVGSRVPRPDARGNALKVG